VFLSLNNLSDGIFPGKIGVADFILDHDSGMMLAAVKTFLFSLITACKNTKNKIDDVGHKDIEDEPKKSSNHKSTLNYLAESVKCIRRAGCISIYVI
jgi:hypothetical protein